jgi:hypothetical protein
MNFLIEWEGMVGDVTHNHCYTINNGWRRYTQKNKKLS